MSGCRPTGRYVEEGVGEALVRAAMELFSSRSYSSVSVGEVASRAGVSKGALFHYFSSKLELAREALSRLLARTVSRPVRRIARSDEPLEEKLRRLLRLSLETARRYDARSLAFLIEAYSELRERGRASFVRDAYEESIGELASMLSGVSERPRARARLLAAVLDGLAVQYLISPEEFEGEALEELEGELEVVFSCRTSG